MEEREVAMGLSSVLPYSQRLDKIGHDWTSLKLFPECSHLIHAQVNLGMKVSAGAMEPVARGEAACKQGLGVIPPVFVCVLHADGVDDALADLDRKTRMRDAGILRREV